MIKENALTKRSSSQLPSSSPLDAMVKSLRPAQCQPSWCRSTAHSSSSFIKNMTADLECNMEIWQHLEPWRLLRKHSITTNSDKLCAEWKKWCHSRTSPNNAIWLTVIIFGQSKHTFTECKYMWRKMLYSNYSNICNASFPPCKQQCCRAQVISKVAN